MDNLPREAYQDMLEPEDCFFSDLLNLALREKDYKKCEERVHGYGIY